MPPRVCECVLLMELVLLGSRGQTRCPMTYQTRSLSARMGTIYEDVIPPLADPVLRDERITEVVDSSSRTSPGLDLRAGFDQASRSGQGHAMP